MPERKTYEKRFSPEDILGMEINLNEYDGRKISMRQLLVDETIGQRVRETDDVDFWGVVREGEEVEVEGRDIVVTLIWEEDKAEEAKAHA